MSIRVALDTVLIATPIGVAAAYSLSLSTSRFTDLVAFLVILPTLIPAVITAVGPFLAYSRIELLNTTTGLVIGHVVMAVPFVFVVMTAGFRGYDFHQERAANSLGASPMEAFYDVTLPQICLPIGTAALLALIVSLNEVLIGLFVATGDASTLARLMFLALSDTIDPTIAAVSSCLVCTTLTLVIASQVFAGRWTGT